MAKILFTSLVSARLLEVLKNKDLFCQECGGICEYVSMPKSLLPQCNSAEHYQCSKNVFDKTVSDINHRCRSQKSCTDVRYGFIMVDNKLDFTNFKLSFEYTVEAPQSSQGQRASNRPYKGGIFFIGSIINFKCPFWSIQSISYTSFLHISKSG